MTDTNQKLREALQVAQAALINSSLADHKRNWGLYSSANEAIAEALALPTAALPRIRIPTDAMEQEFQNHYRRGFEAGKCAALPTADHIPDAGKMINGLTQAETDASASVSGLTAAPVGDRELPPLPSYARWEERIKTLMQQCGHPNSMSIYQAFKQFQNEFEHELIAYARAALSAGDAVAVAKEREECAKVCDSTAWATSIDEWRDMTKKDVADKSMHACAAAIRARGEA